MPYGSHAQVGKAEPMPDDGSVTSEELASTWRAENESRRLDLQERQHVASTSDSSDSGSAASGAGVKASLTRKLGPLPVWGWIIIGGVGAYLLYKHFSSSSSSTGTNALGLPTSGAGAGGGGGGYSGGQGAGTVPTSTSTNPLAKLVQQGGGYWIPNSEQPIQDVQSGNWFAWLSPNAAKADPGVQRWIQIAPGNFIPVKAGQVLPPGTPQFITSGSPVPGYTY